MRSEATDSRRMPVLTSSPQGLQGPGSPPIPEPVRTERSKASNAPEPGVPAYMTAKELGHEIRFHRATIYRLARENPTMPQLNLGGKTVFPRERTLRWLRQREGHPVARCTVAADAAAGAQGRGAGPEVQGDDDCGHLRLPAGGSRHAPVHGDAPQPAVVADLTYVATWRRFVYVAFVIDAFSRKIVDWRAPRPPSGPTWPWTLWSRRSTPMGEARAPQRPRSAWWIQPVVATPHWKGLR
jgi:hypothetical protein